MLAPHLKPFGTTIFAEITRLANQHGAINLAQGFPDFDGPEHVKAAASLAIAQGHGQYARSSGILPLVQEIGAAFQRETGIPVDPETQVTVTSGCTEAIAAALLGLLSPGDEVILFEPYYDSYRACVAMAHAVPRFVTLRGPGFTFSAEDLERARSPRTRAVLLNTPHNPTGRVFTRDELRSVAEFCVKHGLIAICDEVYEKLVYAGEHLHLASFPGMAERTVTLSSLGKTFSLTGWKVGWAVASPELSAGVRAAHQFLTFATCTPMQHAAVAALRSPPVYYEQLRADYIARRDLLAGALRELGFAFRDPEGSYFIYADHAAVSRRLGLGTDVELSTHLIEKVGVAAIPPSVFYEDKQEGARYLRFAFCKRPETLTAAIERLRNRL